MRGLNRVVLSGEVQDRIRFGQTPKGIECLSFWLTCDRSHVVHNTVLNVKVNAYGEEFVDVCRDKLEEGIYVLVEGELMERRFRGTLLTEVRANEIIFL